MHERLLGNILPADLHSTATALYTQSVKWKVLWRPGSLQKEEAEKGSALLGVEDTQAHRVGFPSGALREWHT